MDVCKVEKSVIQDQGRTKGRTSRAAARAAKLNEALRRHWNNKKYGASKPRFPYAKEFLRKVSANSTCALKTFASTVLRRKSLKNTGFKGRHCTYFM